ncbi:MAG: DUF1848 domain-containing protein [Clostridia bacterium]|nr:DUF1848 domain-containing protein [Clostridia bacterium]
MIISASRRTDIPALYADWFFHRLNEGFVCVRNPMNPHQVSKIPLNRDAVDGFVFWTKNPVPMMNRLHLLEEYPYYFQFTLTSYGRDAETNVPSKNDVLIPAFRALAEKLGRHRVVWRYDPIFISETYTAEYHIRYFAKLAEMLADSAEKCTISFLDFYKNTRKTAPDIRPPDAYELDRILTAFSETAKRVGITIDTCAEEADLSSYGITHAACIDTERLSGITGKPITAPRDRNQRKACGCASAVDIGAYNTCVNGCRYCYANYILPLVQENHSSHNPLSPLLIGNLTGDDRVTVRKTDAKKNQIKITEL